MTYDLKFYAPLRKCQHTLVANEGSKQKAIISFYRDDSDTVSFGLSYDHRQMMYESIVELTSFG